MISSISYFFNEIYLLFIEMSPYLLLGVTVAGLLSIFVKKELIATHIGSHTLSSLIKSALLGVPLPLCSCGVIPTASYLKKYGASKPAVMSFLISTPQTGVDSLIATWGMLGPLFAIFRAISALVTGIIGGIISFVFDQEEIENKTEEQTGSSDTTLKEKWRQFIDFSYKESIDDIAVNFLIGLVLAALISVLIPDNFFSQTAFDNNFLTMLVMVIIGIPMYICSTSSIPIAVALILKGVSPGAAYVFLVAGPATNIATLAILINVLGKKQTLFYLGTIIVGSLIFGLIMDKLSSLTEWTFTGTLMSHHMEFSVLDYLAAVIFALLLIYSLYRRYIYKETCSGSCCAANHSHEDKKTETTCDEIKILIEGMNCHHCSATVTDALKSVKGVKEVHVDLHKKEARITGNAPLQLLKEAIIKAGYQIN